MKMTTDTSTKQLEANKLNAKLGGVKLRLGGSIKKLKTTVDFETALDTVMRFVANPYAMWEKGILNEQRIVLRLVFTEKLLYRKESGFETARLSLPFELSGMVGVDHSRVVDILPKSLHRLEQLIMGWAEQISSLNQRRPVIV